MLEATAYIGANNETKAVDLDVIKSVADKYFGDGYTILFGQGCWQGGHEDMVAVVRTGDDSHVLRLQWDAFAREVKTACAQQAVFVKYTQCDGGLVV